jgi:hypothetical protein
MRDRASNGRAFEPMTKGDRVEHLYFLLFLFKWRAPPKMIP